MPDNNAVDQYFYQVLVFTGRRLNSGTKSNVEFSFSLSLVIDPFSLGSFHSLRWSRSNTGQSTLRSSSKDSATWWNRRLHHVCPTVNDSHRRNDQTWGKEISRSLGLLNCIRIWHDNSGPGKSASWFLKYIIVQDIQTMRKFHFIGQRWLAVEEDDGQVRDRSFATISVYSFFTGGTCLTGSRRSGKGSIFLRPIEKGLPQCVRRSLVVFHLLSATLRSIYTCPTVYMLFRSAIHFDVAEYHVLRCLEWSKSGQPNWSEWPSHRSTVHHSSTGRPLTTNKLERSTIGHALTSPLSRSVSVWWLRSSRYFRVYWLCNCFDASDHASRFFHHCGKH